MSINYTYEIILVDELARCMEVVYSAEGYPSQHIGTRLPFEGEQVETVVRMYAPVQMWLEMAKTVIAPPVGQSGAILAADEEAAQLAEMAAQAALDTEQVQPTNTGVQAF